jgi:hypothetical protein
MSDVVVPNDGMSPEIDDVLDDEKTIGIGSVKPGEGTVVYEDARSKFHTAGRKRRNRYEIGDEGSKIFISSDGGELTISYGPEFAPIETCIKQWHITEARRNLGKTIYESFDLLFDDSGLVAFRGEDTTVIVAPIQWEWDRPHVQTAPCGPRGPSI